MKTNRRIFLKNVSMGAAAITAIPNVLAVNNQTKQAVSNNNIKKVHLIFKTHLDIGFTASSRKIARNIWEWKIPSEIRAAREVEKDGFKPSFNYGSWAVYNALEYSKGTRLSELEKAIHDNIITWNGMPFSLETEYYEPALFESLLGISHRLDKLFNKETIAAKISDVPCQTIGIVPLLHKAGIKFLHVGVNWAAKNPDVPDTFVWRHPDGSNIVVMYCKGGYGKIQGIEGHDEILGLVMKGDNMDPMDTAEIQECYAQVKAQYPEAVIQGSDFNAFAQSIVPLIKNLPEVTHELGDTWIYGAGSDPTKTSRFREASRVYKHWVESGVNKNEELEAFSVLLGMTGEHTWGMDHYTYLDDLKHYSAEDFKFYRKKSNFRIVEESWNEKRELVEMAIEKLSSKMAKEINEKLETIKPKKPKIANYNSILNTDKEINTAFFPLESVMMALSIHLL